MQYRNRKCIGMIEYLYCLYIVCAELIHHPLLLIEWRVMIGVTSVDRPKEEGCPRLMESTQSETEASAVQKR